MPTRMAIIKSSRFSIFQSQCQCLMSYRKRSRAAADHFSSIALPPTPNESTPVLATSDIPRANEEFTSSITRLFMTDALIGRGLVWHLSGTLHNLCRETQQCLSQGRRFVYHKRC